MTHAAAISRLLRNALVMTGSSPPPDLRRVITQIVKIAAHRVGNLSSRARIGSPHFAAGATAVYNLHVRGCRVP